MDSNTTATASRSSRDAPAPASWAPPPPGGGGAGKSVGRRTLCCVVLGGTPRLSAAALGPVALLGDELGGGGGLKVEGVMSGDGRSPHTGHYAGGLERPLSVGKTRLASVGAGARVRSARGSRVRSADRPAAPHPLPGPKRTHDPLARRVGGRPARVVRWTGPQSPGRRDRPAERERPRPCASCPESSSPPPSTSAITSRSASTSPSRRERGLLLRRQLPCIDQRPRRREVALYVFDVIADLLALGIDPERATLFVQSDVPETTELAWLLTTVTPMGWPREGGQLQGQGPARAPRRPRPVRAYPVLQAADILLYDEPTSFPSARTRSSTWRSPATSPSGSTTSTARGRTSSGSPSRISLTPWRLCRAWTGGRCPRATTTRSRPRRPEGDPQEGQEDRHSSSTPVEALKNPETDNLFQLVMLLRRTMT